MKVGITVNFQFSFFSGGGSSTTIATAELCKKLGYDVYLVNVNGTQDWWDDCRGLKTEYPNILHLETLSKQTEESQHTPLDILLEVTSLITSAELRKKIANQCVWVVRKPILLNDIENSIYPLTVTKRTLEGLTAIWALDLETTKDELEYLEVLSRGVPVRHVPFIWSPTAIEAHKKDINGSEWIQILYYFIQQKGGLPPWSVHICETNTSASSSCTIPLVALREVKRKSLIPFSTYKIHNAEHIQKNDFFTQNVMKHCEIADLSGSFFGRQRIVDWIYDPASVVFSHIRFRAIRPMLLDTVWSGIPLVHNSKVLQELGSPYYYSNNSVIEAGTAFTTLHQDLLQGKGMFQTGALDTVKAKIREKITCESTRVQTEWKSAFASLPRAATSRVAITDQKRVNVLFTDMWDDFNPDYNMFLLMMSESLKYCQNDVQINGYSTKTLPADCTPNILIFGPFGSEWKQDIWKDIKKVHFTGENTRPQMTHNVELNLGYAHADFVNQSYIRFPLWMIEIDWFGADPDRIQNPKPLPIDRCTTVYPGEIGEKTRFCAFVVTNPCNPLRNNAFHWLSQYKKVDSAGRLFNNIGDEIFAGLGGGGGELKKHAFLKKYKFSLAYENASSQGYTTEKLLHAKAAGCIPIYWGDPKVERDFQISGMIDARKMTSPEELIAAVKKIDENPSEYLTKYAIPALDDYKRDLVRRTLREVSFTMLKIAGIPEDTLNKIPPFIGAKTSQEAITLAKERTAQVSTNVNNLKELPTTVFKNISRPLVITYATRNYLSSLQQLLAGIIIQKNGIPDIEIHVWLTQDVPEESRLLLKNTYPDVMFFHPPETVVPEEFLDYWDPQHFAWKCWLLNHVCSSPEYKDRLVLYLDAGVFCCRWPSHLLRIAYEDGICLLEDPRQINDHWCHDTFKQTLHMTESEKKSQQIAANIQAFKAGHPDAVNFYSQTYHISMEKKIISGIKWEGVRDGKPFGHRHDQSIMSLLSYRMGLTRYPLDNVYCDISLRKTFITGKAFYVHRGQFQIHKQFTQGIDDAYVVNLDRRKDRMEKLYETSPSLQSRVQRVSAVEGRDLVLTPQVARLFKPHDFLWKKAIMGCALSHLGLWWQLANEKKEINNYLILEDDVKLAPQWEEKWKEASAFLPEDYDIIYLGGILPPNQAVFDQLKEQVNPYFARVAANSVFGQKPPNHYFHWCAYSYVLSRRGAEKVLQLIHAHDGYWTSADHILCNHVEHMKIYFLNPLVAGCYQDEDPRYKSSAFNDFNRIDQFDSDLWNNDNRFTTEEISKNTEAAKGLPLNIHEVLIQLQKKTQVETELSLKHPANELMKAPPSERKKRLVCLKQHGLQGPELYESIWLRELLGPDIPLYIDKVELSDAPPTDSPIVFFQKNHIPAYIELLKKWNDSGSEFYILHLSDEHVNDDISVYSLPKCKGVIRMYERNCPSNVLTVPLGYHHTIEGGSENPLEKTPRLPFRSNRWSFTGTNWGNRKQLLEPFSKIQPNRSIFVDSWESTQKIQRKEYLAILLDSYFVPCPVGNNAETFRIYEALECGCIPLYVKNGDSDTFAKRVSEEMGILPSSSWSEAVILVEYLLQNIQLLENYRADILNRWVVYKKKLAENVKKMLAV